MSIVNERLPGRIWNYDRPDKASIQIIFVGLTTKYPVGTQRNGLCMAILVDIHNICFITKIAKLLQIIILLVTFVYAAGHD